MEKLFLFTCLILMSLVSSCCGNRLPILDGGSIQRNGQDVYWEEEDFPLLVLVDENLSTEQISAVERAAYRWNYELGTEVFITMSWDMAEPAPRNYGIVGVSEKQLGSRGLGELHGLHSPTFFPDSNRRMGSMLWYDIDLDSSLFELVMVHELGHALTLDHDPDDCRSVMHPHVSGCPNTVYIMPDDIDRVKNLLDPPPRMLGK